MQELLKVIPRCLCVVFSEISVLFILRVGCVSGIRFQYIALTLAFPQSFGTLHLSSFLENDSEVW